MLHAKYQLNPPGGSGEEEFGMVFTIYGQGCHLSNVTWTKYKFSLPLCLEAAYEI